MRDDFRLRILEWQMTVWPSDGDKLKKGIGLDHDRRAAVERGVDGP